MTTMASITIGSSIRQVPEELANALIDSRERFDALTEDADDDDEDEDDEDEDEDEEEEDDEEDDMSFADKMKAAKAKKAKAKKDSSDVDAIVSRIDSLEAENEVLASLVDQTVHEDADDDEDMEYMTPQEIALQLVAEFEKARPFLPPNASVADYSDIYDIYEDAIETRAPGIILTEEMMDDDADRVDPTDADELRGAFKMLRRMANPMQMQPIVSMDSADRSFAEALGLRSDGCGEGTMIKTTKRTEYY